jgi:hypothetical protein
MAVDALGKEPEKFRKMGKEGIQPSIDWMAGKMGKKPLPGQPHNFGPTGLGQAETGAHAVGLHYGRISPTSRNLGPLDSALAKGRMVVLTAHLGPGSATYRHAVYNYQGPHGILIMGRTNNGKYLVADPLSRTGVRALDKATVESFLTYPDEGGLAVWP